MGDGRASARVKSLAYHVDRLQADSRRLANDRNAVLIAHLQELLAVRIVRRSYLYVCAAGGRGGMEGGREGGEGGRCEYWGGDAALYCLLRC